MCARAAFRKYIRKYTSCWWHANKKGFGVWQKAGWPFCPGSGGWYCSVPIPESKLIRKFCQTAFCSLWATRMFLIINLKHLMGWFTCGVVGTILVMLSPPTLPAAQPVPHELYTWILLLKTSARLWLKLYFLNALCAFGQLSGSVWYFIFIPTVVWAEQPCWDTLLIPAQLFKGAASAAPARSACVLRHLGRRPHSWAGVASPAGIAWEFWGCCWGWLVSSWPGHTAGSVGLSIPAASHLPNAWIYDSDGFSTQSCLSSSFVSLTSALLWLSQ